ncbi:MAG TPA: hypothetical protein VK762_01040 [Polyangiaceae bacterium]|jgi:Flp pilus assembly protein TadB|nr:hypothetical protein [Polyangiaceae bacterium]
MADSISEATSLPPAPPAASSRAAWAVGVFAFLALIAASVVSVGLAAIVWVPLLMGIGIAMVAIASARRRRQSTQGRNSNEIKDPTHAHPPWPTKGVIDDRLPEP